MIVLYALQDGSAPPRQVTREEYERATERGHFARLPMSFSVGHLHGCIRYVVPPPEEPE